MPPLAKRRRLLDNAADVELHEKRLRNNKKLKSRFESIFERYSKDFEGIGDIIDLSQNHIVVDNGHLRDMKGEKDLGSDSPPPIGGTDSLLPESPSTTLPIELIITDSQDDASDVGDESDEDYKNDERDEDDKDDGDNAGDPLSIFEDALATSVQRVRKSNLGATSDSQNVATSNPRLLVEVEELDTPALSTATALSPARISKAELKSQLASSLIPEAQSCELATLAVSRDGAFADHSLDHAIPPCRAITQTQTSTVEDDEDDLQILFEPNVTTIFQRKGRHSYSGCKQRLAFRLSLGGDDISDDELSIPAKT
ncbi:MAG: hypothetical protein Q9198_002149 [Flavoplaca austrocitrina]